MADVSEEAEKLLESSDDDIVEINSRRSKCQVSLWVAVLSPFLVFALTVMAFYAGFYVGQQTVLPHLPTHGLYLIMKKQCQPAKLTQLSSDHQRCNPLRCEALEYAGRGPGECSIHRRPQT